MKVSKSQGKRGVQQSVHEVLAAHNAWRCRRCRRRRSPPLSPSPPSLCRCPQALKEGQRIDGRTPYELRHARFTFALDDSSAAVQLGGTRCLAVVTATLDAPFGDRPSEGTLRFNVEFSPMASPAFEPGQQH